VHRKPTQKEQRDKIRYAKCERTRGHFHNEINYAEDTNDKICGFSQKQRWK
jgi:hypothetical protein